MSTKNTVQIDARREEFRKYLEKEGILESLTKVLVTLYEEPDKPSDALSFVRNNFAASEMQIMRSQVENLTKENEQLKTKVTTLETDKAALEKKINEMEEMAKEDKKDEAVETSSSPKRVDEVKVPNESPQEASAAEDSPQEASKEDKKEETYEERSSPKQVEEIKVSTESTQEVSAAEESTTSPTKEASDDAMETDAPQQDSNAA